MISNPKLTLEQRRAKIRQAVEAAGFSVFGKPITIDGKEMILRLVLPQRAAQRPA